MSPTRPIRARRHRSNNVAPIPDLGSKIDLLLTSRRAPNIETNAALSEKLDVSPEYLSRIKGGSRPLTEDAFVVLCELFDWPAKDWYLELPVFGSRLGLSRTQIAHATGRPLAGLDFLSRIRDLDRIRQLLSTLEGYWESFYFSVSKMDRALVSRDLVHIDGMNEEGFITCTIKDGNFDYAGVCFPIQQQLYFILEKQHFFDEIIVYSTNYPDRRPPLLFGVLLCTSGGVDTHHSFPAAAKVAFRHLGSTVDLQAKYGIKDLDALRIKLEAEVPSYIDPEDATLDEDTKSLLKDISNVVSEGAIPRALRMAK